jgi:hypothetical protein
MLIPKTSMLGIRVTPALTTRPISTRTDQPAAYDRSQRRSPGRGNSEKRHSDLHMYRIQHIVETTPGNRVGCCAEHAREES